MIHKHHIIPKHMGGSDDPSNIVELTVEEHADAHHLLWCLHKKQEDYLAYKGLAGLASKQEIVYLAIKLAAQKAGDIMRGRPVSLETRQKLSVSKAGSNNPNYGKRSYHLGKFYIGTHRETGKTVSGYAQDLNKLGFDPCNVWRCANGKRKSYKGYTWTTEGRD